MGGRTPGRIAVIGLPREATPAWLARLADDGYRLDRPTLVGPDDLRRLGRRPPRAIVIDLGRAPARGRDLGLALRQQTSTRRVPLVFVARGRAALARVRALPPDAVQATDRGAYRAVTRALAAPPLAGGAPLSVLAGYSGTPLPQKLGITPGARVVLVAPPPRFAATLGPLPPDVPLHDVNRGARDLTLWFTRSKRELARGMASMARAVGESRLWIAWPKKTSRLASDHTELDVRRVGLAAGLVDFKICAVDVDWSGLAFVRRRR